MEAMEAPQAGAQPETGHVEPRASTRKEIEAVRLMHKIFYIYLRRCGTVTVRVERYFDQIIKISRRPLSISFTRRAPGAGIPGGGTARAPPARGHVPHDETRRLAMRASQRSIGPRPTCAECAAAAEDVVAARVRLEPLDCETEFCRLADSRSRVSRLWCSSAEYSEAR
jgi:hypothetical protein